MSKSEHVDLGPLQARDGDARRRAQADRAGRARRHRARHRADRRAGAAGARGRCPGARAGGLPDHRPVGGARPDRHHRRRDRGGDGRPARAPPPPRGAGTGVRARDHPADQLSRREGIGRRGAHHPGRHGRAVLELAVVPARAVRGLRRPARAGADRHLHERPDGADPGGAGGRLRARQRVRGAQDQHRPGRRRALSQQRLRPGRRRARQRHGGAELCALRLRDAGHAHDHGRAAGGAISRPHLVGPADGADAHRRHHHGGRHLCRRRRAGLAQAR